MKYVPITERETPRKCTVCQKGATRWAFNISLPNEKDERPVDKSSRRPLCDAHQ